ncbi:MAG: hypothetical protein OEV31_08035 [Gammaproteobacteria bacterium]|nr:hypothetical protein [Gammaproteobacteria bacterium]
MNHRVQFTNHPPGRPSGLLGFLLIAPLLVIGALLGFVVLAVAFGLLLLAGLVFFARLWWLRRKILRAAQAQQRATNTAPASESETTVLEGEYRIIRENKREE